jgi:hypothetical protein
MRYLNSESLSVQNSKGEIFFRLFTDEKSTIVGLLAI